jgi:hypothetical protein
MSKIKDEGNKKQGAKQKTNSNVVSIFTGQSLTENDNPIIRIAPELDGLEMLYSNNSHPDKLYSLKICCWALRVNGEVHGMVPWLNKLVACTEINDPLDGHWQGYRDSANNNIFYQAPEYKVSELQAAALHFCPEGAKGIAEQEVPDSIGTHAALTHNGFKTLTLIEVHSWKLNSDGNVTGLFVDYDQANASPVLNGDKALLEAQSHPEFKYFFQHRMANKIKNQDPDAMEAISLLIDSN